jgi:hypothetical protein
VEVGCPGSGDGNLLCSAQLPGAFDPMAAHDLNQDKLKRVCKN